MSLDELRIATCVLTVLLVAMTISWLSAPRRRSPSRAAVEMFCAVVLVFARGQAIGEVSDEPDALVIVLRVGMLLLVLMLWDVHEAYRRRPAVAELPTVRATRA